MCGIVGFKTNRYYPDMKNSLRSAVSTLSHRGPDAKGLYVDEVVGLGLGHCRLSVIDPSPAGHQPMAIEEEKVWIVYNGEIYNFKQIREKLESRGHRFQSDTDTEVVLRAYLEWGIDSVKEFIGMFAFGLWDGRKNRLILARDRLGIKPLYYYLHEGVFIFASELKALMVFECFSKDVDQEVIPLFLHYQYIPSPKSIFRNTYKLLPGHYLIYEDQHLIDQTFWDLPEVVQTSNGGSRLCEEELDRLDSLIRAAVSDCLVSDVPVGALLSGGIDSSLVVALMQKVSSDPVRTFSIGFREWGYNEAPWAARVANHLGTNHTELYVSPADAMRIIPQLPEICDEPFADSSVIPTVLVSQLARSQVTVALSGDGGDEQFAGYVRYWTTRSMATKLQRLPTGIRKALLYILNSIPSRWVEKVYVPWREIFPERFRVANFRDKWQKFTNLLRYTRVPELYRAAVCVWPEEELPILLKKRLLPSRFDEIFRETESLPLLTRLMRVDLKTYLPDGMLTKVDRASMAVSLEVRVPLLDHRVVEHTSRLHEDLKYRNGIGKYILKQLLARYVPKSLFERPKMGFGVPLDKWFRRDLRALLLDYLSAERLGREGLFDSRLVEKKIREHLAGTSNHHHQLWALLMWEMWRERWIDG